MADGSLDKAIFSFDRKLQRYRPKPRFAMTRATIRDVAALAGVSTATVSRVLNQKGSFRQETKERVWQAIESLGFWPNSHARNLARKRRWGFVHTSLPKEDRPSS